MECNTIFFIVFTAVLGILLVVFIVLWIVELNKQKCVSKKLMKQQNEIGALNKRLAAQVERKSLYKLSNPVNTVETVKREQEKVFVFGVADNISLVCNDNEIVTLKSLNTKIVDNFDGTESEILDLSKYVPAFHMLNNRQVVSLSAKTVTDNLKISIPYGLPTDEIVKTRVLYGTYVCTRAHV